MDAIVPIESELDSELTEYLGNAVPTEEDEFKFPIKGCKAVIAP